MVGVAFSTWYVLLPAYKMLDRFCLQAYLPPLTPSRRCATTTMESKPKAEVRSASVVIMHMSFTIVLVGSVLYDDMYIPTEGRFNGFGGKWKYLTHLNLVSCEF